MTTGFDNLVEVNLLDKESGYAIVCETLTRIGMASFHGNVLCQSCHLLHHDGQYFLCHFKEMLVFDGVKPNITTNDLARRNTICGMLQKWGLVEVKNPAMILDPVVPEKQIKVIQAKEKKNWTLKAKVHWGKNKSADRRVSSPGIDVLK